MLHFQVTEGLYDISITVLPGCIFLTGNRGYQIFAITAAPPIPGEDPRAAFVAFARALYKDKASLEGSAQLYTEGFTNRERFKLGVEKLLNGRPRKITEHDRNRLRVFIDQCDCAPPTIKKKMDVIGFGRLLPDIDFIDKDPRLEASVDALWSLLA